MTSPVKLLIVGASGRMGTRVIKLMPEFPGLRLHAALASHGSASLGRDSGEWAGIGPNGVLIGADLEQALVGVGLVIDFSSAVASAAHVRACAGAGVPLLLGTTALGTEMPAILEQAARRIPLIAAPNTSLAVTLLQELVGRAAAVLGDGFDIQIEETHHRSKLDTPSGTALGLGAAALQGGASGFSGATATQGLRGAARVGYAAMRGGDVVGDHAVYFLGQGERLCLSHSATDRSIFARGALRAGGWLLGRAAGAYRMADVFF